MSASFITQCPHCLTSFRVNQAQLGAANGAVRCGACLKVFNAPQHMLGGTARSGGEPIQPPAAAPKPAAPAAPSEPRAPSRRPASPPSAGRWRRTARGRPPTAR
ncbi:MJ0042-type zinc finger domain-containing protein [Pseudomonas sp. ADPe]|uniref:MJ0042-type zinc finger domain-containing protein n=1 Tax=Pseudomonas sp. ADPe TaxID=2774873 RepID=UPI001CE0577F